MNKLVKAVRKEKLCSVFLKSLNGILLLTDRELELLEKLIEFDITYDPSSGKSKNVISTANRKRITAELGITHDNLSRYIKRLKLKGLIVPGKAEDEMIVNKILIPEIIKDRMQISIILKIDETAED